MTRKVISYITRERGGEMQHLMFERVDHPNAGVQMPKGAVEPGEAIALIVVASHLLYFLDLRSKS